MKFNDIKTVPHANYRVDVHWQSLEKKINEETVDLKLDLNPDFQRGYVWTEKQQIKYCEWILRGGKSGRILLFNCIGWSGIGSFGDYVIVDGKQRLNAALRFLRNEIPAFGTYFKDFSGNFFGVDARFEWYINDLPDKKSVLEWYIDVNEGLTAHTPDEIERVKKMMEGLK